MADKETTRLPDGELEFHFEKASFFRVIHVDGAFGGVSPGNRLIHMSVYSERQPIPKKIVQKINHGVLGEEIPEKRIARSGIFRELEADLVMSLETATAIRVWLDQKINELQQIHEQIASIQHVKDTEKQ